MFNAVENLCSTRTFQNRCRIQQQSHRVMPLILLVVIAAILITLITYNLSTPLQCYQCSWSSDTLKPIRNSSCHLNQRQVKPNKISYYLQHNKHYSDLKKKLLSHQFIEICNIKKVAKTGSFFSFFSPF